MRKIPYRVLTKTIARSYSVSRSLAGTVPFHDCYVLLHTQHPPSSYPGKVKSRLQRSLQLLASQWGGIINFSWSPEQQVTARLNPVNAEWEDGEQEAYRATAFSSFNGILEVPEVNMRNLEEVNALLSAHASPSKLPPSSPPSNPTLHLHVCTHGERDCRCGDTGGKLYEALRREVRDRGLLGRVRVLGVGHVGGHKYAANLLIYPWGDWLGNLQESNAPGIVNELLSRAPPTLGSSSWTPPLSPSHWRGRMGLDKEEQLALVSKA